MIRQLLLLIIILYSGASLFWIVPGPINRIVLQESLVLSVIALMIYVSRPIHTMLLKHQFFSISNLLVFSVFIVHFGEYLNFCVNGDKVVFLLSNYANISSRISTCAFSSLTLGLIYPVNINKKYLSSKPHFDVSNILPYFFLFFIVVFVIFAGREYFTAGGNNAVLNGAGMNPIGVVGNVSCIGVVMASVVNAIQTNASRKLSIVEYVKCFKPLFWLCVAVYLSLVFISGDRGPIIDVLLVLFVGQLYLCRKKIGYLQSFLLLTFASVVLTIMAFFRGNEMELSIEKVYVVYDRFLIFLDGTDLAFNLVMELSSVINTFHLVLGYIDNNGFIYGSGMLFQLLAFFPGIRYILFAVFDLDINTLSTDQIATSLLNEGVGAGTTCISDAYYNLGLVGTVIFFILYGSFIAKLDRVMYERKCKTIFLVIALCYMARAIYIGRSTALQPINLIVYTSLFLYVSRLMLRSFHRDRI